MAKSYDVEQLSADIRRQFNCDEPQIAFICGGARKVAVDGAETRARRRLLANGVRYFSRMQTVIYAVHQYMRPTLFLDVGSNYGECLFAKPLYDKTPTFGFEANPGLLHHLEKSALYNDDVAVEVIAKAVADVSSASLPFYVNTAHSGMSSAARTSTNGIVRIDVPATTLDDEIGPRGCDLDMVLIKIDVEGFEPKVLAGAKALLAKARDAIVLIEFDSKYIRAAGVSPEAFFGELLEQFEVFKLDSRARRISSIDDLRRADGSEKIHADLVLLKLQTPERRAVFEDKFCKQTLKTFASETWDLKLDRLKV